LLYLFYDYFDLSINTKRAIALLVLIDRSYIDFDNIISMNKYEFDFIIIGSGIAGLTATKHLSSKAKVCVITKNIIKESATQYAQGGIAAALKEDDTPKYHIEDTLKAGAGLCNEQAVEILAKEGISRVKELIQWGANFDKINGQYDFTKEAAHNRRRILHAGDETGKEIEKTIGRAILSEGNVTFFENTTVVKLLVENNQCFGCFAIHKQALQLFTAKAVIIATGGCCQVFARNTNPPVATGDGISLGFNAGCDVQDMEFIQFHPTTLYLGDKLPISMFLISEAVRGEGAILRNIYGERFMLNQHPDAELAPRDIVARSIYSEMKKNKSQHVFLDLSGIRKDIKARFPNIYTRCIEAKIDIKRDFIPVAPAAHYFMGGIKTDINGRTSVSRLYAIGEVASLGLHGANRLASNSLLDGLVFGYRAAKDALKQNYEIIKYSNYQIPNNDEIDEKTKSKILAAKQIIRKVMWQQVGIERNANRLEKAIQQFETFNWISKINTFCTEVIEVQNMLIVAKLMTAFALKRTESRGGHYRSDYPEKDDVNWKIHQTENLSKSVNSPVILS
jgi:L-aspartate oxidase